MKNWTSGLFLFFLLFILINSAAYADGYGGPVNNTPIDKTDDPKCNDGSGSAGKPVFLDGTEVYSQIDLDMNGLYPIRLTRLYSSQSKYDNPLGHGWAFVHDRRLFEYPDNSVVIRYGCGWQDRYVNTGGTYQTPKDGMEGTLVESNGTYIRTYRNGAKDFYDTEGRLVRNQSPAGHYHEYTYDAAGLLPLTGSSVYAIDPSVPMVVAQNYHLLRIEEFAADGVSTGNRVDFTYNSTTGRLMTATARSTGDSTGRGISYQHDISDGVNRGRLEKVIGLESIESNYIYQAAGNGNDFFINSFQEGAGTTPYVNALEAGSSRVATQTYGLNKLSFSYPVVSPETTVSKTVYDDQGNLIYSNKDTVSEFDNEGYVKKVTDPLGNEKRITRDGLNHLKREEFWTNTGTVASPSLVLSRAVDYIFDAQNNKLEEKVYTGVQWDRTRWTYDNGWVASESVDSNQFNSQTFRTEYSFYRDGAGVPTNIQEIKQLKGDGSFQITTLTYDSKNRLTTVQYPDAHKVQIKYDAGSLYANHIYHEIAGVESPYLNYRLDYTADGRGNIAQVTDPKGQPTTVIYDDLDRIIQIINPLNESTYYRYNGRLLDELEIGATLADGEGQVYKLLYTAKEEIREVQRKDDAGVFQTLWTYTYDSAGNMLSARDASNRQWKYAYDELDRLTTISDPLTYLTQYKYDILGNISAIIDAEKQQTDYAYDAENRVTQITNLAVVPNLVTKVKYDPLGNLIQVTDPENQTTQYQFDRLSRLTREIKPLGQILEYFYDSRNRLDYLLNARKQKIDYAYEAWGALKSTNFYATASSTTSVKQRLRAYDNNGNLTSIIDSAISATPVYSITHDALNRIDTLNNLAFLPYKQLDYDHDRYGNVSQLTLNSSSTANGTDWVADYSQQYIYNKKDLLAQATFNAGKTHRFDYYPTDELKQIAFNNGTVTDYAYYNNGPTKWIDIAHGASSKEKLSFTYDRVQNIKDMGNNNGIHSFAYDGINRLIQASHPLGSGLPMQEDFAYDDAGNREDPANSTLYSYDQNNRISLSPGVASYIFDDDGNLTQKGTAETFVYDYENQLVQYSNTNTGVVAKYSYDPFGRRIKKELTQNSVSTTTYYLWDRDELIGEYSAAGVRIKRYSYTADRYAPLQMEDTTGIYNVHTDHLDAPVALTDQAGDIVWEAEYEAYGNAVVNEDVDGDGQRVGFDLRRPGQWLDAESGLYYNYFRYYDPGTGRYISSDPIGIAGGLNIYAYAAGNPLKYIDPLGLIPPSMVPQGIINNSQIAVNNVTNNAFTSDQISTLTNMVISTISLNPFGDAGIGDALNFGSLDPNANPMLLSESQNKSLQNIFKSLKNDNLTDSQKELLKDAIDAYKKSLKSGRCIIVPDQSDNDDF